VQFQSEKKPLNGHIFLIVFDLMLQFHAVWTTGASVIGFGKMSWPVDCFFDLPRFQQSNK
jgi:hypothetical protein